MTWQIFTFGFACFGFGFSLASFLYTVARGG
jgi:hypothetical protein